MRWRRRFRWFGTTLAGHVVLCGGVFGAAFFLFFLPILSKQPGELTGGRLTQMLVVSIAAFSIPGVVIWYTLSKPSIEKREKDSSG